MSAEKLIETMQASELLTTVLPDSINKLYASDPDALGLASKLDKADREAILQQINEFKKNAMEFRKSSNWLNLLDRYDIKVIIVAIMPRA